MILQSLAQVLREARDQNKKAENKIADLEQKLVEAQGDIKVFDIQTEVYDLHEVCQPSVTHTMALYSKCTHACTTSLVTGFAPPARPAVGHRGIGVSTRN